MPTTKAGQRAVNKYIKNNYDRLYITVPKGEKERLTNIATQNGVSLNQYVCDCIKKAGD